MSSLLENHGFFFLVFTRMFHILQYTYKSFNILCKASGVFANRTASPANKNKNNLSSLTVNNASMSTFMFDAISFTKSKNKRVELGSPCFTPMFDLKKS